MMTRMFMKCCLIGLALTCVMTVVSPAAAAPELVRNGKAVGEFILPADASQVEIFGVMDVRHWIEQITGVKVPVLSTPSADTNTKVYVGTSLAQSLTDDLAKLANSDGYAIRTRGNNVYVFGSRPRGTMYGIFALLLDNSDLIFARPNIRFGTVHGQSDKFTLEHADKIDLPVFWFRGLRGGYPPHETSHRWLMRMGINNLGDKPETQWDMILKVGQNLAGPMRDQFKEHPEFFALNLLKGGRHGIQHGEGSLCLTQPGLAEAWVDQVIKYIEQIEEQTGSKLELFTLGPGDNWYTCVCDLCIAPINLPDGSKLVMKDPSSLKDPLFRSTQVFMFLNQAIAILKKKVPHVRFVALAYIYTAEPPAVKINPDLLVYLAPYPTNSMHFPLNDPRQSEVWRERFNKWASMTSSLGFYEYFYSKPSPLAFYAGANMRDLLKTSDPSRVVMYSEYDNDRGSRGIGENALGWDVGAMNTWVIARLFWNPNQDIDALYREYIRRAYREAAPQMTAYYEIIKKQWLDVDDRTVDGAHAGRSGIYQSMIVKAGHEDKVLSLLTEAQKAAQNPNSRTLIRRMHAQFATFSKSMGRLRIAHVPEMTHDGDEFSSVQWEKPTAADDFKQSRRWGDVLEASEYTSFKAALDDQNLYLRFTLEDSRIGDVDALPKQATEMWPSKDHVELWLTVGRQTYLFATDINGNAYDALDFDRAWQSGWRVKTQKTSQGWECIAVIPLSSLPLDAQNSKGMKWAVLRTIARQGETPEQISFQAVPLGAGYFPIEMDSK